MANFKKGALAALALAAGLLCAPAFAGETDGVTPDKVTLGQSAAFSGPLSGLGVDMNQGAIAFFKGVNERGGVHGRLIDLKAYDDAYGAEKAAENTKRFLREGTFALFGYVGTPTSNAALPIFTAEKAPFVGAFTGADSLRRPLNKFVFNVRGSYFDETELIVEHITSFGEERIAVVYEDNPYGKSGLAGMQAALTKRQLSAVAEVMMEPNANDDQAEKAAQKVIKQKAGAVVIIGSAAPSAKLMRRLKEDETTREQFYNVSFVNTNALQAEMGADGYGTIISQVMPNPSDQTLPVVAEYRRAMEKYFPGYKPSFTSLEGFIAAKVMTEALQRSGRDLSRSKFIESFEAIKGYDVGGYVVTYGADRHDGSRWADLSMLGRRAPQVIH